MIDGRRVILTTFAGRRDRMRVLLPYVRAALAEGTIDEWHVWDFARTEEDRAWLAAEFPALRRLPDRLDYRQVGVWAETASPRVFEMEFRARNDLHLRLTQPDGETPGYEIVLGGWSNARSVLRRFGGAGGKKMSEIAGVKTPGLLSRIMFRQLRMQVNEKILSVAVNGWEVFSHPVELGAGAVCISACTGFGADCEIRLKPGGDAREFLFIAKPAGKHPFGEFYNFYADRYQDYRDCVFLKSDDDIMFVDLPRLRDFIRFRIANPAYFLLSANVINNGICAYHQQQSNLIPAQLMELDLPPGGLGGRLWKNAGWAARLHELFLEDPARFTEHRYEPAIVEWDRRLSINFVAWLGADLVEMACADTDDEHSFSVEVPARLGRVNAVFMPFVVSHLSFFTQDKEMDTGAVITKYEVLRGRLGLPGG